MTKSREDKCVDQEEEFEYVDGKGHQFLLLWLFNGGGGVVVVVVVVVNVDSAVRVAVNNDDDVLIRS